MVKIDFNKKGIKLYNASCFDVFPKLKDKSIDLFVLDLPFGVTACAWDTCIDLSKMWIEIKRIMKPSAIICFFCTTKFGYTLIKSNEKWFKYDLVWQKSRKVGFLSANKRQLRNHENIYVFNNDDNDDIEIKRNIELRKYAEKVKEYINKTKTNIVKECGQGLDHFLRISSSQFALPIEKNYKKLIELYKIDKMKGFLKYKDMVEKWEIIKGLPAIPHTYNPQKTEGTPYKTGEHNNAGYYYKDGNYKRTANDNKGDRHPTSIIEHENIYVFNGNTDDNEDLINYSKKILKYIGKTKAQIKKDYKDADHFFRYSKGNFSLPTEQTYKKLIELYKIDSMEGYIKYDDLNPSNTYNPQKTEGTPYKTGESDLTNSYYRDNKSNYKSIANDNKGDRHPTSIIEHENIYVFKDKQGTYHPQKIEGEPYTVKNKPIYKGYGKQQIIDVENKGDRHPTSIIENTILKYNNPHKTIHRTEKPIGLLEYLIKTYSNEGDTVMDFCAGSLSCGIACYNTKRKFIGVEMDKTNYDLGLNRIKEHIEK